MSGLVIKMLGGGTGVPLFSMRRHIGVLGRIAGSLPGIRVVPFSKLLMSFTRRVNTSIIVEKLHTVASFRCRLRVSRAGREVGPSVRAVFLAADVRCSCLDSAAIQRVTTFKKSMSRFIPRTIRVTLERGVGRGEEIWR